MMEVSSLSIFYSEPEDRIVVDAVGGHSSRRLILTRRITRRLLSAFVTLLEKSSVALNRAPADMRTEVIAIEHMSAISQGAVADGSVRPGSIVQEALNPIVVAKVDVKMTPVDFRLVFHSASAPLASLTLDRPKFHRLLAALDQFSAAAEWNIRDGVEWLHGVSGDVGSSRLIS